MTARVLLNAITATAATKVPFTLTMRDFAGNSLPRLTARGLGSGDSILIWEWVNDDWEDSGVTLTSAAGERSTTVNSSGKYAVTAVMATAGPVSVDLATAYKS